MPPAAKTRSGVLAAFLLIAFAITLALWFISRGGNWLLGSSDRVDLSVVGTGELLKISWNHDAREVTHATGAALVIEDGPSRRQVALGPDELKLGVVEYQRVAPRVHVSMILHTATSLQSTVSADWAQK